MAHDFPCWQLSINTVQKFFWLTPNSILNTTRVTIISFCSVISSLGSSSQLPSSNSMSNENRQSANFHPTIWGDIFLSCPSKMNVDTATQLKYEELKQVRRMLKVPMDESFHKLRLIDTMKRLEDALQNIYDHDYKDEESLEATSLRFRLLRENGFNVPCVGFQLITKFTQGRAKQVSRWWKGLDFARKLHFARDRLVEGYFWILGVYFETQYSFAREILTKVIVMASIMEVIYDVDTDCIDELPAYMKLFYEALLDVYKEMEEAMTKEGKLYSVQYAKEAMKQLSQSYLVEAKWYHKNYVPTVDEYMTNGLVSADYIMVAITSFVGMGEIVTKYLFDWASNNPKIVKASSIITRLMDDIVSHKFEQERRHVASTVECHMKQHGVSEEKACKELNKQIENAWKDINQELVIRPTAGVPLSVLTLILNLP
ncbi:hypothetical protein CRYUN_Cryun21dG0104300 [Craigia yunnanensis]